MTEIHNRQTKMAISEKEYGNFYDKAFKKVKQDRKSCNDREKYKKAPSIGGIFAEDINIAESS